MMVTIRRREVRVRMLVVMMIAARVWMRSVRVLVRRVVRRDRDRLGVHRLLDGVVPRPHATVATGCECEDRSDDDRVAHGFFLGGGVCIFFLSASSSSSTSRRVLPEPCDPCPDFGAPGLAAPGFGAAPG